MWNSIENGKRQDHPRFRNSPKCWKDQETRGSSSAYLWTHDNHCRTCTIAWSLLCTVSPSILFTSWHLLQVMNQPRRPFSWVKTLKQSKDIIIRGLRFKPLSTSSSNKSGKPLPRWQYWVNLHLQGSLQLQAHQGIICRQLWQREALPARQLRVLEGQELHPCTTAAQPLISEVTSQPASKERKRIECPYQFLWHQILQVHIIHTRILYIIISII